MPNELRGHGIAWFPFGRTLFRLGTVGHLVITWQRHLSWLVTAIAVSACAVPQPYRPRTAGARSSHAARTADRNPPGPAAGSPANPAPVPAPVVREPTLSAASRALVSQAQAQLQSKNYPVAASSIERALRIEPDNPLLWIELGKVRQAEGNYVQAENMGRKAASMSVNAPRANSAAWTLIAESLKARGKNVEAREAELRAQGVR